ncbi:MAG TPA: selenocysteine-specific translation elongation factor [Terriglobales bacterium]|nr:selenocysteine-specific translation elongation factor [Terriglobales bacterium]
MKSVIVGTAGHIDHGKSALVKALTGTDPDRLQEEKRRGITIDIGFAHLDLPSPSGEPLRLGFVDVPGHERFVRNMLAGVGGIDLVLLVIAAAESIKPQTREHFDICRLLGIGRGITVLTKSDLVDRDTIEVVRLEVEDFLRGSFLEGAPILAVSSRTGAGLPELKQALVQSAQAVRQRDSAALARLPIDRVFLMKGFGTVVTGTLIAGAIRKEEELEVFPGQKRVRVRGLQVHGRTAEQATAGQRTALNLAGLDKDELARGMMLVPPATFRTTNRIDVSLALLPSARPLKDRARVHLHAYTAETVAEVVLYGGRQLAPGHSGFAQLRTADPLLLLPGDRFILRQFSPVVTIGGGTVLDAAPLAGKGAKERAEALLPLLARGSAPESLLARVARRGPSGLLLSDAVAETGCRLAEIQAQTALLKPNLVRFADVLLAAEAFTLAQGAALAAIQEFHRLNPLVAGISKEELREKLGLRSDVFSAVTDALVRGKKIELTGEQVRAAGRTMVLKDEEAESKRVIEQAFAAAGLKVPALKDVLASLRLDKARAQKIVTLLLRDKVLVKISDDLVFHRNALEELRQRITAHKPKSAKIGVADFKDLTGVTRKYAIPLLEYLDRERVTRRVGDQREIL